MKKRVLISFLGGMFFMWLLMSGWEQATYSNVVLRVTGTLGYVLSALFFIGVVYFAVKAFLRSISK